MRAVMLICACGPAAAQVDEPFESGAVEQGAGEDAGQPARAALRLVRMWDFEERAGHLEPVPEHWVRGQGTAAAVRAGFPAWNQAAFDEVSAGDGAWSVKLPSRGGSTSLLLRGGVLPAMPGGDYRITARVKTENVVHARARLLARFLNDKLEPIVASETSSPLVTSEGAWSRIAADLVGRADAAWVQVELQLVQPEVYAGLPRHRQEVRLQDFGACAWFDHVKVFQVPRVDLQTNSPVNVIALPDEVIVRAMVKDLTGQALRAQMVVYDVDGREVDAVVMDVSATGQPADWRPALPALGWYRASLLVEDATGAVGRAMVDFVWAGGHVRRETYRPKAIAPDARQVVGEVGAAGGIASGPGSTGPVLGVVAEDLLSAQVSGLGELAATAGAGWVSLGVLDDAQKDAEVQSWLARNALAIDRVLEDGLEVSLVLERLPADPSAGTANGSGISESHPLDVLAEAMGRADGASAWLPQLVPVFARYGERVHRWQIGSTGDDTAFWRENTADVAAYFEQELRRLAPSPSVVVPWQLGYSEQSVRGVSGLTMNWPLGVPARSIGMYLGEWGAAEHAALVIEPADQTEYGARAAAADAVRRGTEAWATGIARIGVRNIWRWHESVGGGQTMPLPLLAAWRTASQALSGKHFEGELPVAPGVRALIGRGSEGEGVIAAWNEGSDPKDAVLQGFLGGDQLVVRDMFGNATEPQVTGDECLVQLGQEPLFIEGVDVDLMRFRAGVALEPEVIPARAQRHELELIVRNPWNVTISGNVRLVEPEEWQFTPRISGFALAPGGEARLPVSIALGPGEEAGMRAVRAEVELTAMRAYPAFTVPLGVELGLENVQLQPSFRYVMRSGASAPDVVVTVIVTNLGDREMSVEAFALAPGFAGQSAPISSLGPGKSAVRKFTFQEGGEKLRGKRLRVGLKEHDGTGRLNRTLVVQ